MQDDSDDESIASSTSTMTAMSDRLKAEEQKINIARRTVSKYRVALNYSSSSKRKTK